MSARSTTGALMLAALAGIALLMTLKYFPGLENAEAYAGNAFQAIYPDSFPGDPYLGAERPSLEKFHQISSPLFIALVKMTGEIWLDDRFNAVVYLLLVIASLIGVDRIVTHMGLSDLLPRLAIQLMLMRDHQFFNNKVFLAHQADFNHISFAIPATIWLIYATVARKNIWVILGLSVLLAAASIRNAPFVIAICLVMAAMNGEKRERIIVAGVFGGALVVLYAVLFHVMPALEHERLIMWDIQYQYLVPDQMNPFSPTPDPWTMVKRNAIFAVISLGALIAPIAIGDARRNLRTFIWFGVGLWLLSGLFFTFPPDALKYPQILPFTPVRILRWPQTIAYLMIMASVFIAVKETPTFKNALAAIFIVWALLIIGPGNNLLWAAAYVGFLIPAIGWIVFRNWAAAGSGAGDGQESALLAMVGRRVTPILTLTLALAIAASYATAVKARLSAWQTLAKTGVMGDGSAGIWIGIDDYFRDNTAPDTVVLPLRRRLRYPGELWPSRALASRSGRSTPILNEIFTLTSLDKWRIHEQQSELMQQITTAFIENRWAAAAKLLKSLLLEPDYVVIPGDIVRTGMEDMSPFVEEARLRGFVILRHIK